MHAPQLQYTLANSCSCFVPCSPHEAFPTQRLDRTTSEDVKDAFSLIRECRPVRLCRTPKQRPSLLEVTTVQIRP